MKTEKNKKTAYNNAYSLWRANRYQQGFRSVAKFGFSGQVSASKPPQSHMQTVAINLKKTFVYD